MASTHSKPHASSPSPSFDFDSLLTLEDTLYTTAYTSGVSAGSLAGRIEGRLFGLEQGFAKFASLGELHGRSVVWGSRALTSPSPRTKIEEKKAEKNEDGEVGEKGDESIPPLHPTSTRLLNNITLLHSLTDPETFSTQNTEEAVADFDDRVKRAGAKAKVVERILGETTTAVDGAKSPKSKGEKGNVNKGDDSMEDFAGSRLLR